MNDLTENLPDIRPVRLRLCRPLRFAARSLGFLSLTALLLSSCQNEETYVVRRKDLVQAVYASGEVLAADYYEVTSKIPGIVDSVYVSVGQTVEAGAPLLRIKSQTNQLNLQTAGNLYALAQKNASDASNLLTGLRQQVQTAYDTYRLDSLDYERYERLNQQDIGSKQAYERAKLRFQTSANNYIIAKSNLEETRERLQVELRNAKNNYLAQKSLLGDYLLIAVISGKVYDLTTQTGELIGSNVPVIELGAADSFEVELQIDETDIILIKKGQPVVYELDALKDTVFHGQINKIYPKINPADKTAKVRATIHPAGFDLYPNMSLEANIIIQKKKDILVVPVDYLMQDEIVLVQKGGAKETVRVKTGVRDLEYVEIIAGLDEHDRIIKP